jgi:P27 family predicted phage terminase small subunit
VLETFELEEHHIKLLQLACEAWDRAQGARAVVAKQGLTVTNARGDVKAHPLIAVERDARTLFARLIRELDLDDASVDFRPPALPSNRASRV